jgi:hypothetical protein
MCGGDPALTYRVPLRAIRVVPPGRTNESGVEPKLVVLDGEAGVRVDLGAETPWPRWAQV